MLSSTFGATLVAVLASMVSVASAKDGRTFAVLRFHGDGPLTTGRSDPIVNPGEVSSHLHTIQGASGFSNSATGDDLLASNCSTANVKADKSAYWMPSLFFHDKANNTFEPVKLFYMNVYYFFEGTNDDIKPFPVGLQMVSGNAMLKTAPATGNDVLDPAKGTIQPAQFTCPRSSYDIPSYPVGSDGTTAGIQDTNNKGAGAGFPFAECDGYASPLRADLHFPSCYDPSKDLTDYKNNMQFPTDAGYGKQDCPEGWIHTPHIFYEMYWNTPLFSDRWTPNEDYQPFVLANGDATGFSLHGDFLSGWDQDVLQHIIDTCDAGDAGMDKCPGIETVLEGECHIDNPSPEVVDGVLTALPGNNPIFGWEYGTGSGGATTTSATKSATSTKATSSASTASTSAASSSPVSYGVVNAAAVSSAPSIILVTSAATSASTTSTPVYHYSNSTSVASSSSSSAAAAYTEAAPGANNAAAGSSHPAATPTTFATLSATKTPAGPVAAPTTATTKSPTTTAAKPYKTSGRKGNGGPCRMPTGDDDEENETSTSKDTTTFVTIPVTVYKTETATATITVTDSAYSSVGTTGIYARREGRIRRRAQYY
ncbi:hypothetical protein F503_08038 [Ophiostoma piceae UAMH 11346]|uniref:DUF1996 domain-containing protein n=1 Tax=Ophiostoma piceae (strain UAMH 11346) TaxID=1262450 RepID=S3C3M8_OPHP1|nr:hypothetical protein F503_08038 [Ophiostoma piceae UAMH 11346]